MDKIFNGISIITGIAGGITAAVLGAWNELLWALVAIMALDYVLGIMKAIYSKTLSSEIGFKGLLKKITMIIIVALANVIQTITGGTAIREIVIMFYIANEGISILENAAVIYPDMPDGLKDILLQLRGDSNADK